MFHYVAFFVAGLARDQAGSYFPKSSNSLWANYLRENLSVGLCIRARQLLDFQCFLGDIENGVFPQNTSWFGSHRLLARLTFQEMLQDLYRCHGFKYYR